MRKTIEQKTSEAILQKPKEVEIGGVTYQVAPPSTATLILVSEIVSQLPRVKLDKSDVLSEVLRIAKDCKVLGEIAATIIVGARQIKDKGFSPFKTEVKKISERLLYDIPPSELSKITISLLAGSEIADFFGLTVSLIEVNMTRETVETTASGQ